jgi:hypothetical protein
MGSKGFLYIEDSQIAVFLFPQHATSFEKYPTKPALY